MQRVLWTTALFLAAALMVNGCVAQGKDSAVKPFELTDQQGATVQLSDFRGRSVVLTFLYTSCPDECPLYLSNISKALEAGTLTSEVAPPQVVVVTVDPDRDTPARLQEFSRAWPEGWRYLTGSHPQLEAVWKAFNVSVLKQPVGHTSELGNNYEVLHTAKVILLDKEGRLIEELRGEWTADTLAQTLAATGNGQSWWSAVNQLPLLTALLKSCGEFAATNPWVFASIVLVLMLPGLIVPAFLLLTFLSSEHPRT